MNRLAPALAGLAALAAVGAVGAALALPSRTPHRPAATAGVVPAQDPEAPAYDGRFTFARIRFATGGDNRGFGGRQDLKWDHDYPDAERNLVRILNEITTLRPRLDASAILTFDDPELFRHPIAYLCEPGFWTLSDAEAAGLAAWLAKGGFLIVDDFAGMQWYNFEAQIRRALPESRLVRLDARHPIFDSFYRIESLDYTHPYFGQPSEFWGIFENNDPAGRLLMIVNYNNDIGDYWEWSDRGFLPVEMSNEAYKLGINYIVYGMTR